MNFGFTNYLMNRVLRVVEPGFSRNTAKTIFEKIDTWMFLSCDDYRYCDCCLFLLATIMPVVQSLYLLVDNIYLRQRNMFYRGRLYCLTGYYYTCNVFMFFMSYRFLYCVAGVGRFRKRSCEKDWLGAGELRKRGRYINIFVFAIVHVFLGLCLFWVCVCFWVLVFIYHVLNADDIGWSHGDKCSEGWYDECILQKSDKGQIFYWSSQTALGSVGGCLFVFHLKTALFQTFSN